MQTVKKCNQCGRTYTEDISYCLDDGKPLVEVETMIGKVIDGRYRLDSLIGKGGMGDVYRATHVHIDSEFAVKLLKPEFVANETAIRRFRLEARAAGRIQHPNAVRVTDFGVSPENIVYLVMDLISGHSLRNLMGSEAPMDFARTVGIVRQVCAAVDAAHRSGVIHRDIKPDNILIEKDQRGETVKVLDFGIAKLREAQTSDLYLTQAGTIIGTPQYMSPEQCQGKEIDSRSDIYSIGIILYEMLTGKVPFDAVASLQVVYMQLNETPPPLGEAAPHVPEPLVRVVERALNKKPEDRPSTAQQLSDELKRALEESEGHPVVSAPDPAPPYVRGEVRTPVQGQPRDTDPEHSRRSLETRPLRPGEKAAPDTSGGTDRDTSGARVTSFEPSRRETPGKIETPPTLIQPSTGKSRRLPILIASAVVLIALAVIFMMSRSKEEAPRPPAAISVPDGMVLIEGGKFTMGRDDGGADEGPAHEVAIAPFLIDINEVTNQDYKKFVDATGHKVPSNWKTAGSYDPAEALFPVTHVTWDDASAYAEWAGKRLPKEAEWEYVARGGSRQMLYPWGNQWQAGYANIDNKSQPRPAPVRSHVRDVSPFGVYDMAGNVSEWVEDFYSARYGDSPDRSLRVYRGGNFLDPPEKGTATYRWADYPGTIPADQMLRVGFRCAKTVEQSSSR